MKKLLLLLSFVVFTTANSQDYWTEQSTAQSAVSTGMRSISIVDPQVTWLSNTCGTTGCTTIRRYSLTTNGGTVWSTGVVDLGAGSANLEIANIHGVSATTAFASVFPKAAGALGGVWKTIDSGATWLRQASATYNDAASFANLVYFWDSNNGVTMGDAIGGFFEIYTTTNGGANWVRTPSSPALVPLDPNDYGLTNQFTTFGNSIWIGTTFGRILKSTDKGLTWTVVQSPIPDFGGGINGSEGGDLSFSSATNGLLITTNFLLYNTVDGGFTWNPVTYSGPLKSFGIASIPTLSNTYVSVGSDLVNDPARGSSWSNNGGLNWYDIDNNPDTNLVDGSVIAFLNPTTGFASGFSTSAAVGGIFKWNGNVLSTVATSQFASSIFSISPNPTTGVVNLKGSNINQVAVTDILGKVVLNNTYSSLSEVTLNMSDLNSGVYFVKVTNNEGTTSTSKVVKQ